MFVGDNISLTCVFTFVNFLNYFFISLLLIIFFNLNYILNIFKTRKVDTISWLPAFNFYKNYQLGLYIIILLAICLLIMIHKHYLQQFLDGYQEEINLIKKLKGSSNLQRLPFLCTGIILNFISILLSWMLSYMFYYKCNRINILKTDQLFLLNFNNFKLTLLFLLLIIGIGSGIGTGIFLFWKHIEN